MTFSGYFEDAGAFGGKPLPVECHRKKTRCTLWRGQRRADIEHQAYAARMFDLDAGATALGRAAVSRQRQTPCWRLPLFRLDPVPRSRHAAPQDD
ncbi:hypothetical protein RSP03_37100 [Cereibacter sphaeroides]|nr:hypothetical protein RSP03_37100 [Cereibacter sphaeroides]